MRQGNEPRVGTRAYADVELAQKQLGAREVERGRSPQFSSGASAAYDWALGRADRAPVTGAGDAESVPDLQVLTAEVDAAVVQMEDPTGRPGPRDYNRGVHDALAWVCGHSDEAP
ncbi:hypothetical protein ACFO9E_12455 [Streptomyces maoxianensis]|uniref:Uncharacterized protein n=1 Tax=Streptomyces maoxianensis TaxID=1459942 RepID=A0ABV9G6U2_9ACTN